MARNTIKFNGFKGVVLDTSANAYTKVEGSGSGVGYGGVGSMTSYVSSTTSHTRDVWLRLQDGTEVHRRYFADVPVRKGEALVEISVIEKGEESPFALYFPSTKDTWFLNRSGFNYKSSGVEVTLLKAFISWWIFVVVIGLPMDSMGYTSDAIAKVVMCAVVFCFVFDLIRRKRRNKRVKESLIMEYSQFMQHCVE